MRIITEDVFWIRDIGYVEMVTGLGENKYLVCSLDDRKEYVVKMIGGYTEVIK
jgi:hypothetical protein